MNRTIVTDVLRMRYARGIACLVALCSFHGAASASKGVWEEHEKLIQAAEAVGTVGPDQFGEQINFQRGGFSLRVTDVSLPGNSRLPVEFSRSFVTKTAGGAMKGTTAQHNARDGALGDWEIDLPHIGGVFPQSTGWIHGNPAKPAARCSESFVGPHVSVSLSSFGPHDYSQGVRMHLPNGGGGTLLTPSPGTPVPAGGARWITSDLVAINCLPTIKNGSGEGFVATASDGTRYWFDWIAMAKEQDLTKSRTEGSNWWGTVRTVYDHLARGRFGLYATRVEDRFGNWVNYTYTNAANAPLRLSRIESSDGRLITVAHNAAGYVHSVTANGRHWTYNYSGSGVSSTSLASVALPDGSNWALNLAQFQSLLIRYYQGEPGEHWRSCVNPGDVDERTYVGSVRHPSGATAEYTLFPTRFVRHGIDYASNCAIGDPNNPNDDVEWHPSAWDSYAIVKKRVHGAGIQDQSWNYDYQGGDRTMVTGPGDYTRYTFGNTFRVDEGKLLSVERGSSAADILHREDYSYELAQSGMPYPTPLGRSDNPRTDDFVQEYLLPQKQVVVSRGGDSFTSTVNTFDVFGRATRFTKSSSLGASKTEQLSYLDDLQLWVLGLLSESRTGTTVVANTEYNAQRLPLRNFSFGRLEHSLGYHADGTLATVTDALGHVTHLSNWKRGAPGLVRFPATDEAPTGASRSATIDDNGWVTSLTDELGSVTAYSYDPMGRLSKVVYPGGDALEEPRGPNNGYFDRTRDFRALTAADWKPEGVAIGQWRVIELTGHHATITYMDALWRPVLKHDYDNQNIAPSLRSSKTRYDTSGRVSFESYPSTALIPGDTGTRTFYDALDRVVRVEQDSEHGVLATTSEHLSGLRLRVTNPRGTATTTHHLAWDQPTYDFPTLSEQAEGKRVEIGRHPQFGWPLELTQRDVAGTLSATRRYVYDGHAQLCKTIEPETGVTVTGHDAAGNPIWQASGLDGAAPAYNALTDCQHAAAQASGRVVTRSYDARHRLTRLSFPNGGQGDQVWTYEKDGLPRSVTAYNNLNSTVPVVTTYSYNRRRQLTGETLAQPGWYTWSLGYAHDGYGHLAAQTYPTGLVIDYAPNPLGQPTQAGAYASGAQYYPNGALRQFTYGNGVIHTMTQNARQLPARVTSSGGVSDYSYAYDYNGNPTQILDEVRGGNYSRWMSYDALDRLTAAGSASFGGDHWHRMSYDALDNLKSWKLTGVKDYADYVYDTRNRLSSIRNTAGATAVSIEYDAQGNLRTKDGQSYQFDFGNRLRTVVGKESYRYDGLGRRVTTWKLNDAAELWMYSQAGQMLFSSDWQGPNYLDHKTHEKVYLAGSLIATIDHAWPSNAVLATQYHHTDALGSPVAVTNAAGQVIERLDYEPWGAIIGKPNHNGIGYTGHIMDGATGLTYMQQRYYDPSLGRFLSVDPVAPSGGGANFSRYKYAANNPYRFVDPDGRKDRLAHDDLERITPSRHDSYGHQSSYNEDGKLTGHIHITPGSDGDGSVGFSIHVTASKEPKDMSGPAPTERGSVRNPQRGSYSEKQAEWLMRHQVARDFNITAFFGGAGGSVILGRPSGLMAYAFYYADVVKSEIVVPTDAEIDALQSRGLSLDQVAGVLDLLNSRNIEATSEAIEMTK